MLSPLLDVTFQHILHFYGKSETLFYSIVVEESILQEMTPTILLARVNSQAISSSKLPSFSYVHVDSITLGYKLYFLINVEKPRVYAHLFQYAGGYSLLRVWGAERGPGPPDFLFFGSKFLAMFVSELAQNRFSLDPPTHRKLSTASTDGKLNFGSSSGSQDGERRHRIHQEHNRLALSCQ